MYSSDFITIIVSTVLISGCFAPAMGEPPLSDEYVVWVEALNMRAEPSKEAEIVVVLEQGDELMDISAPVVREGDLWWRHVRSDQIEGWIADWYALPRFYYDVFREADELGKMGKAEEMVDAVVEAGNIIGFEVSDDVFHDVSHDGKNIILWGAWYCFDWGGNYPDGGRVDSPFPVALFASDR